MPGVGVAHSYIHVPYLARRNTHYDSGKMWMMVNLKILSPNKSVEINFGAILTWFFFSGGGGYLFFCFFLFDKKG